MYWTWTPTKEYDVVMIFEVQKIDTDIIAIFKPTLDIVKQTHVCNDGHWALFP